MALDAEQIAAREEAVAWLKNLNMDRDGYTVAARLEAAFPDTLGDAPLAPEAELEAEQADVQARDESGRFA
jgi:hypothetical protein